MHTELKQIPDPLTLQRQTSAGVVAVLVMSAFVVADALTPANYFWCYGYTVPVAIMGFSGRKSWVCLIAIAAVIFTYLDMYWGRPTALAGAPVFLNRSIGVVSLLLTAIVVTFWVDYKAKMEEARRLAEANAHELESREEEIARQNEELHSQTEELERQSEELRVTNEELAQRERMLETLLDLSRALTVELAQGQIMDRICETLWHLIDGAGSGTAILMKDPKQPDRLEVHCSHGMGGESVKGQKVPAASSFASIVLAQMRTAFVEDLALRPDLVVPRPANGEPIRSVLAAPLLVRGKAVGTLEIYSREKRSWSEHEVVLAESLAAQAAISLENGMLFEEIERERTRLSAVLRAVPFGILVSNADGTEIRANPAGAAMFNIPSETPVSLSEAFSHITALRDGRALMIQEHPIVTVLRSGREIHGDELEWLMTGGRRLHVLISAVPIRERDGKIVGSISVKADITQLKTLQRELDLRRREAEEANLRKTRFLAAASHDIRTPANAISLLAELIKRTADSPQMASEVPQLAGELHASALSLVELVTNVLDVTRFDTDKLDLRESDFPLGALLEEETRQAQPLADAKKIKLEFDRPNPPLWLRADRIKLGRVLGNLLSNAIKFTDDGGVKISTRRLADGGVEIAVTDTGIGISDEHLSKVFDEFYQITDPNRSKGSGLGLAICKRLTEAMGGDIRVRSTPGDGSTFMISLPPTAVVPRPETTPLPNPAV